MKELFCGVYTWFGFEKLTEAQATLFTGLVAILGGLWLANRGFGLTLKVENIKAKRAIDEKHLDELSRQYSKFYAAWGIWVNELFSLYSHRQTVIALIDEISSMESKSLRTTDDAHRVLSLRENLRAKEAELKSSGTNVKSAARDSFIELHQLQFMERDPIRFQAVSEFEIQMVSTRTLKREDVDSHEGINKLNDKLDVCQKEISRLYIDLGTEIHNARADLDKPNNQQSRIVKVWNWFSGPIVPSEGMK